MRPVKWYKGVAPVAVFKDRQVLGYKNGRLCKMDAEGKITNICSLPRSFFERITESSRLLRRMFRRDVRCACFSASGDVFFFKDKTLYRYADTRLQKICPPEQGMSAPLNIAPALEASGYEVLWGDYSANDDRREVRIWGAKADGTAAVVYRFPAGCLRHVHNIVPDRKGNGYYILTGDNDPRAGIYYSDALFKNVEPLFIGTQQARAVQGFAMDNGLLYATDSVTEQNYICMLEKTDAWRQSKIAPINGSCIYAAERGGVIYFSTTVESPETEGQNRLAALLSRKRGSGILSDDVEIIEVNKKLETKKIASFKKDRLPYKLFQYGAVTFPPAERGGLALYPVAVKKYDGRLGFLEPSEEQP